MTIVMKDIFLKLIFNILVPEVMKIEKVEKLVPNLHDKKEYLIHIRYLKQALNHELVLKKSTESVN